MFSHDRTLSAGTIKKIIGWAAGSVPLRLQQLNSVESRGVQMDVQPARAGYRGGISVFDPRPDAWAHLPPPVVRERRHHRLAVGSHPRAGLRLG
jgi:hypothetical protein